MMAAPPSNDFEQPFMTDNVNPNGKEIPQWWQHGPEAWFRLSRRARWSMLHGYQKRPSPKWQNWHWW